MDRRQPRLWQFLTIMLLATGLSSAMPTLAAPLPRRSDTLSPSFSASAAAPTVDAALVTALILDAYDRLDEVDSGSPSNDTSGAASSPENNGETGSWEDSVRDDTSGGGSSEVSRVTLSQSRDGDEKSREWSREEVDLWGNTGDRDDSASNHDRSSDGVRAAGDSHGRDSDESQFPAKADSHDDDELRDIINGGLDDLSKEEQQSASNDWTDRVSDDGNNSNKDSDAVDDNKDDNVNDDANKDSDDTDGRGGVSRIVHGDHGERKDAESADRDEDDKDDSVPSHSNDSLEDTYSLVTLTINPTANGDSKEDSRETDADRNEDSTERVIAPSELIGAGASASADVDSIDDDESVIPSATSKPGLSDENSASKEDSEPAVINEEGDDVDDSSTDRNSRDGPDDNKSVKVDRDEGVRGGGSNDNARRASPGSESGVHDNGDDRSDDRDTVDDRSSVASRSKDDDDNARGPRDGHGGDSAAAGDDDSRDANDDDSVPHAAAGPVAPAASDDRSSGRNDDTEDAIVNARSDRDDTRDRDANSRRNDDSVRGDDDRDDSDGIDDVGRPTADDASDSLPASLDSGEHPPRNSATSAHSDDDSTDDSRESRNNSTVLVPVIVKKAGVRLNADVSYISVNNNIHRGQWRQS